MAELEILKYPDPRLNQVSEPVTKFDGELHRFLENLFETMQKADGIGIAAPQVNRHQRIFVIDLGLQEGYPKKRYEFINPRLSNLAGSATFEEGCLSVPGIGEKVTRSGSVTVSYQDRHGKEQRLEAEGLFAVAIQHETDHLDGVLFVDRVSPFKRHLLKRKLAKQVKL